MDVGFFMFLRVEIDEIRKQFKMVHVCETAFVLVVCLLSESGFCVETDVDSVNFFVIHIFFYCLRQRSPDVSPMCMCPHAPAMLSSE